MAKSRSHGLAAKRVLLLPAGEPGSPCAWSPRARTFSSDTKLRRKAFQKQQRSRTAAQMHAGQRQKCRSKGWWPQGAGAGQRARRAWSGGRAAGAVVRLTGTWGARGGRVAPRRGQTLGTTELESGGAESESMRHTSGGVGSETGQKSLDRGWRVRLQIQIWESAYG